MKSQKDKWENGEEIFEICEYNKKNSEADIKSHIPDSEHVAILLQEEYKVTPKHIRIKLLK